MTRITADEMIRLLEEEHKWARKVPLKDLEAALPELDRRGYIVHSLEASELNGEWEVPVIWLSLLGLDGDENWENHEDPERHLRLVREKIEAGKKNKLPIIYEVFLDGKPEK